ncbi:MAG: DUF2842 domain-containing protein [Parvularculaceae bacterium]|nr:DUF2842 domain-containing protein [Parvularculaceae bacterium]
MSPRLKKLIGLLVLLPGLLLYIGAVATLAERVPKFWLVELFYYVAAGVVWALPAMPLIKWMNSERPDH